MTDSFWLDSDGNLRCVLLETCVWLRHGFGTQSGTLPDFPMATVKQIHSAEIVDVDGDRGQPGLQGEADALITARPGLAIGVKTADCVPILLVDTVHHVVAAVHAGWRGTAKEIAALTVARMMRNYETNPFQMYAAIGPAIGSCCYEVGPEVARQFGKWDERVAGTTEKSYLDLEAVNAMQLADAGVPVERIALAGACTSCSPEIFFSYRKEGDKAGRMMSWIATL